jgi:hypothetical protein
MPYPTADVNVLGTDVVNLGRVAQADGTGNRRAA